MQTFLSQNQDSGRLELTVDRSLFSDTVAMKSAYAFLDRAYFFFRSTDAGLVVQILPKAEDAWDAEQFALEYADELLATHLRVVVEVENKTVRETIVKRALGSYADLPNFTSIVPEDAPSQIDFDKDIDEILKEIENDPDLKIDEEEIERILAEIEAETQAAKQAQTPTIDLNKLKDVKKKFGNK